jgi:hypothetical protein
MRSSGSVNERRCWFNDHNGHENAKTPAFARANVNELRLGRQEHKANLSSARLRVFGSSRLRAAVIYFQRPLQLFNAALRGCEEVIDADPRRFSQSPEQLPQLP